MRSLDQRRAALAYQAIAGADADTVRLARGLPDLLRTNGLLAAWAFLIKKDMKKTKLLPILLQHLRDLPELEIPEPGNAGGVEDAKAVFRHWVGGATGDRGGVSGPQLRALTAEALAFAGWLKRAAETRGDVTDEAGDEG